MDMVSFHRPYFVDTVVTLDQAAMPNPRCTPSAAGITAARVKSGRRPLSISSRNTDARSASTRLDCRAVTVFRQSSSLSAFLR